MYEKQTGILAYIIVLLLKTIILASIACGCIRQPNLDSSVSATDPVTTEPAPIDITPVVGKTMINPKDVATRVFVPEGAAGDILTITQNVSTGIYGKNIRWRYAYVCEIRSLNAN